MSVQERLGSATAAPDGSGGQPRALVLARAWSRLGDSVAALSNASGHPLARTVKLILDPLVVRPVQHPHLAAARLTAEAAGELSEVIAEAADDLRATAAWFTHLKRARRRARITEGNPQDLYFQRCYELARSHGEPGEDAEAIAAETVAEMVRPRDALTVERLRERVRDPQVAQGVRDAVDRAWRARRSASTESPTASVPTAISDVVAALSGDDKDRSAAFAALVTTAAGTRAGSRLDEPGVARGLGLSARSRPEPPTVGESASKTTLPRPFDRSVFERLFAAVSALAETRSRDDIPAVLADEAIRSAAVWQLGHEESRLALALGVEVSRALGESDAATGSVTHRRIRERWQREAYVRRARRLHAGPSALPERTLADVDDVRGAYVRRLWARLHGRELRDDPIGGDELPDTLEGVLRSVVMDHRQRLKRALANVVTEST